MNLLKEKQRRRGVILTPQGWNKLQTAKSEAELQENFGNRYTYEVLSDRTGLSVDTLNKLFSGSTGVDKQSLRRCFSAFNLALERSDYYYPEPQREEAEESDVLASKNGWHPSVSLTGEVPKQVATCVQPELPGGQVPLDSPFYVQRPPIESRSCETILEPGALIRIKAPKLMGKTSLMAKTLAYARKQGNRTVVLNFQLAEEKVFTNIDRFLQWFCIHVGKSLGLANQLEEYWDDIFGSNSNTTDYFENYLLAQLDCPLVLALDEVDRVFQYPAIASDFFGLLRVWYEKAKYGDGGSDLWQKLRLVVVHSTEVYIPLNTHQSPFNVGLSIELPEFNREQVQDLARQHGLDWSKSQVEQVMALVGGHPHLVRLAFYHISQGDITLEGLLQTPTSAGIYSDHLQRQLWNLQKYPELMSAFARVVTASAPVELDLVQAFKLQSMGLVHWQGDRATLSYELYHQYFRAIVA
jgi:hypothetical protein